ncbi:GIY-YIG nuclease family protein [Rhizobium binae]|uniref:GIY-YIG nuclease family protein n=1 Tax=Rhizobium binae TaxID=1138190 RepID=UPI001C8315B6|nr:GIY-YIG nuclease family protein [Rhizobium binae]MBX4941161.1 GIY-YIG nuclease family protein [Rhizobium binae]
MPRTAANDNRAVDIVAAGDGNIEWKSDDYHARLKTAGIEDQSPLMNLHALLCAARWTTSDKVRRDRSAFVYVISDIRGEFSKIGYAVDPIKRLASLQTGNPLKLYIHRSFMLRKLSIAKKVEYWSHAIASERHGRLEGEWFQCSPSQAHSAIEAACNEVGCGYLAATPTFVNEKAFIKGHAA